MKISTVHNALSKLFLKNQKCLAKYLSKLFGLSCFPLKPNFQCAFDDNLSVTYVFIKQISGLHSAEGASPSPAPPTSAVQGVG
jgi:hypothetical protein